MSDKKDKARPKSSNKNCTDDTLITIDVAGKDPEIWKNRSQRFHERLINSVKKMLGNDIPASATADKDLRDAVDSLADAAQEKLKKPALMNLERQASIQVLLAEAKEKEANARRTNLEADKLEIEIERERVLESQRVIDLMIQRGELTVVEKDGETLFILRKA